MGSAKIIAATIAVSAAYPTLVAAWIQNTTNSSPAAAAPAASASACCLLAANTPIVVELTRDLSSNTVKRGDAFPLRVSEAVMVDGKVVIPAGATGGGEVVDAGAAGFGGKPGKLVLAARYVDVGGVRVALRAFHVGAGGQNASATSEAVAIAAGSVIGFLVPGGNVRCPAGFRGVAKVVADVRLDPLAGGAASASSAAPATGGSP
jgi:hypothetical protein